MAPTAQMHADGFHASELTGVITTISWVLGWINFLCWALSSYPQPITNFRRKSVTGLAVDTYTINVVGHSCYVTSCLAFLYSDTIRAQYRRRWGKDAGEPTVRVNDLAYTVHALFWSWITLSQFHLWGYTRLPSQHLSRPVKYSLFGIFGSIGITSLLVFVSPIQELRPEVVYTGGWEWLDVVYLLGHLKLIITLLKYYPQAYLNFRNKSTRGFSVYGILLDFVGCALSLAQLSIDASLTPGGIWTAIANPLKLWLALISIVFDCIFATQHYILYPIKKSRPVDNGHGIDGQDRGLLSGEGSMREREYGTITAASLGLSRK